MTGTSNSEKKKLVQLFTQGSHHRNLSIFYIVQNPFKQGASSRTISLNSQYIVVFKNPRDSAQIQYLAQEVYPRNRKFLIESFLDATQKPHSYLLLNMKQDCEEWLRVVSNIFPGEETQLYVQNDFVFPEGLLYKS